MIIIDDSEEGQQSNSNKENNNILQLYQPPYDTNKNEQSYYIQFTELTKEQYEFSFTLNYSTQNTTIQIPTIIVLSITNSLSTETTLSLQLKLDPFHITHNTLINIYVFYFSWNKQYFLSSIQSQLELLFSKSKKKKSKRSKGSFNEFLFPDFHTLSSLPSKTNPLILMFKFSFPILQEHSSPPSKYSYNTYTGIANEGNTCYMNTIIQTLYHLPFLRKEILSKDNQSNSSNSNELILFTLKKIIYSLYSSKNSFIQIKELFHSLGKDRSFWNSPQDFEEMYSYLYEIFSSNNSSIKENCEGELTTVIEVPSKEYISRKKEKFLFLQLDISNKSSSLDSMLQHFFAKEYLTGNNRYLYISEDNLHSYQDAQKHFEISKLPNILYIQLKRFYCDVKNNINKKLFHKIEYSHSLEMKSFLNEEIQSQTDDTLYTLYAVIVHSGTCNQGHYFAYIYDANNEIWHVMNDKYIEQACINEVFEQNYGGTHNVVDVNVYNKQLNIVEEDNKRTAYILIYINKAHLSHLMADTKIDNEIGNTIQHRINMIKEEIENKKNEENDTQNDIGSKADLIMKKIINKSKNQHQLYENTNSNRRKQKFVYKPIVRKEIALSKTKIPYTSPINQQPLKFSSIPLKDISYPKLKLSFSFIINSTNHIHFSLPYTYHKESNSPPLLVPSLLFDLKQHNKSSFDLNISTIKLICLNSLGLFLEILNDTIDISSYLEKFHRNEIYLVFYVFEIEETINLNDKITSVNVYDINFYNILVNNADKSKVVNMKLMEYPLLILGDELLKNIHNFISEIETSIKLIYKQYFDSGEYAFLHRERSNNKTPLFIIESSSNLESITHFSSIKVKQLSPNEDILLFKIQKMNKVNRFIYAIERSVQLN